MNAMLILTLLLSCVWLSWYVTRRFVLFAMEQRLLDIPNGRSSHRHVTPRGGGVSFVIVFLGATLALQLLGRLPWLTVGGFLSGSAIALIGYLDDRRGLPIRTRLVVHLLTSVAAVACFLCIPLKAYTSHSILVWVGLFAAVLLMTWLINLFNFMDGIDGLAGSEAVIVAAASCLIVTMRAGFTDVALLYGVLAVAASGFLIWNWHPARIFMGDAGSCFLGYSLGALSLFAVSKHEISPWSALILVGVFVIDATMTLLKRMRRGERWYKPHRLHAFQHASKIFGHRNVVLAVIGVNVFWLVPWALMAQVRPALGLLCLVAAWAPVLTLAYLFHAGEVLGDGAMPRWRSLVLIVGGQSQGFQHRAVVNLRSLVRDNMPAYRAIMLLIMCVGCSYLALLSHGRTANFPVSLEVLLFAGTLSIGQFFTLLSFGLHRSHWYLISMEELPNIVGVCLTATLIGLVGGVVVTRTEIQNLSGSEVVLDALLLVVALLLGHMLAAAISRDGHVDSEDDRIRRVVIHGADSAGVSISSEIHRLGPSYELVGFVDGRKGMVGVHIAGGRVIGADTEIRRLVDTYSVDHVLISSSSLRTRSGQAFLRECRAQAIDCRIVPSIHHGFESAERLHHEPTSVVS
jgi:Fuc2NAc and GlcNAc transferase